MKNFHLPDSSELLAVRLIRPPEPKNVWFLLSKHDVRRVDKNFLLADSSELNGWLDSFRPPEPKNVWFLVSRHDVRRVHEKFSSRRFERAEWLLDSFRPPEPKNVWVLLSRHDVRRVHEKFSSRRIERAEWLLDSFRLAEPKTFDSYFLDMMYVDVWWKIYFSPIRASWWLLDSLRLPEAKKRLIPTFLTWCNVQLMKNFLLTHSRELMALRLISASWAQKTFDSYLLEIMYLEVDEKFSSRRFDWAFGC